MQFKNEQLTFSHMKLSLYSSKKKQVHIEGESQMFIEIEICCQMEDVQNTMKKSRVQKVYRNVNKINYQ